MRSGHPSLLSCHVQSTSKHWQLCPETILRIYFTLLYPGLSCYHILLALVQNPSIIFPPLLLSATAVQAHPHAAARVLLLNGGQVGHFSASDPPMRCPPLGPHCALPCHTRAPAHHLAVPSKSQAQLTTLGPLHLLLTTWYSVPRSSTLSLCFLISAQMPLLSIGLPGLFQVATLAPPQPFCSSFLCFSPCVLIELITYVLTSSLLPPLTKKSAQPCDGGNLFLLPHSST